jgi:hypothetical protein
VVPELPVPELPVVPDVPVLPCEPVVPPLVPLEALDDDAVLPLVVPVLLPLPPKTQAPTTQLWVDAQAVQALPCTPHAAWAEAWQTLLASQQPSQLPGPQDLGQPVDHSAIASAATTIRAGKSRFIGVLGRQAKNGGASREAPPLASVGRQTAQLQ